MPTLAHRLKLLEGEPLRAAAAFLAAALPHAEPDEREAIYVAALHTGRPDALAAVIGLLHRLGPGGMAQVCDVPGSLEPAVRLIRRRGSPRAVLNAVAVARRRCDLDLFGHLVALLSAPDDQVQRRAGEALVTIVVDRAGPDGRRLLDPTTARRLDEAVAGAVIPDRDRRLDEVLLAAAVLANRRCAASLMIPITRCSLRCAASWPEPAGGWSVRTCCAGSPTPCWAARPGDRCIGSGDRSSWRTCWARAICCCRRGADGPYAASIGRGAWHRAPRGQQRCRRRPRWGSCT